MKANVPEAGMPVVSKSDSENSFPPLLYLAEGNSETSQSWSGSSRSLVRALRAASAHVQTVDVLPGPLGKLLSIALSFHPNRTTWSARYHSGAAVYAIRSAKARRAARKLPPQGAVLQNGATFSPGSLGGRSLFFYCDGNAAFAARGRPYSSVSGMSEVALQRVIDRERRLYERATAVFTFSEALRRSFIDDFGLSPERVVTVYGGSNLPLVPQNDVLEHSRLGPPTILFVGRAFERKGGPDLLEAFSLVRSSIPDARLIIAGASPEIAVGREGVEVVGYVDPTRTGPGSLNELYSRADIFCLPSRYEPFGVVFVEAMLHGVPCVGSRAWAMPEIITENKTGWLAPPGAVEQLAAILIHAFRDRQQLRSMGARGRADALSRFTWARVAQTMMSSICEWSSVPRSKPIEGSGK